MVMLNGLIPYINCSHDFKLINIYVLDVNGSQHRSKAKITCLAKS